MYLQHARHVGSPVLHYITGTLIAPYPAEDTGSARGQHRDTDTAPPPLYTPSILRTAVYCTRSTDYTAGGPEHESPDCLAWEFP